jgi:hypothetical protein
LSSKCGRSGGNSNERRRRRRRNRIPAWRATVRPAAGIAASELTAPAVFVGFAIHAPEFNYSDFAAGIDVKGKIAVILAGSPKSLPATAKAHYSREKTAELVRRGAVGIVTVNPPAEDLRRPWPATLLAARFPAASLVGPDGQLVDVVAAIRATALLSPAGAAKLFAHSPKPFAAVVAAADKSTPQHFDFGVVLTIAGRAAIKPFVSANVLAVLPGTDPALARDPIVITSHLDHLGIGTPVKGDAIYNGAIDNAIGVGALLAAARHLAENKLAGRRPIVFAAVTAEEKGLLGARHLSRNPPAGSRWAANLNVDAGPFFAPLRAAIGMGKEHTTLGPLFEATATRLGWAVRPDPKPEERRFVRSDQYAFVREGIPALRVVAAPESTDPKVQAFVKAFQAKFNGEVPDAMAALGYDSAMVLADAIKRAGSTEGAKVRDALAATKDFPCVTGKTTLDAKRDASKSAVIITVKEGKFKYLQTVEP